MFKKKDSQSSYTENGRRAFLKGTSVVAGTALVPGMTSARVISGSDDDNGYIEYADFTPAEVNGETVSIKAAVSAPQNPDASGGTTKELGLSWMTSSDDSTYNDVSVTEVQFRPQDGQDLGISPLRAYVKETSDSGGFDIEYLMWAFDAAATVGSWYTGIPVLPLPGGLLEVENEDIYAEDSWTYDYDIATSSGGAKLSVAFGTESASGASGESYPLELVVKGELIEEVDYGDTGVLVGKAPRGTGEFIECTVPFTIEFS